MTSLVGEVFSENVPIQLPSILNAYTPDSTFLDCQAGAIRSRLQLSGLASDICTQVLTKSAVA